MEAFKFVTSAIWLFYIVFRVIFFFLLEALLSPLISRQTFHKMMNFLCLGSNEIIDGESEVLRYPISIYQRSDGNTFKLGCLVSVMDGDELFAVKMMLVNGDLSSTSVVLKPVSILENGKIEDKDEKEQEFKIEEVTLALVPVICSESAKEGMLHLARSNKNVPQCIQKYQRRHQLAASMRKNAQQFLEGFSLTESASLGCINWMLDLDILGLTMEKDFSTEYRIESFVDQLSPLDLLMGKEWDVRTVSSAEGFRIILTLKIYVDSSQELSLKMHGSLVSGQVDKFYRTACLKDTTSHHTGCHRRLSDVTQNATAGGATGLTLAWDEFQIQSAESSLCKPQEAPTVGVIADEMMFVNSECLSSFPSTSTAFNSLDKLLSALPQSQMTFGSPPKEDIQEKSYLSILDAGPNTSTPADELDQSHSRLGGNMSQIGDTEPQAISPHGSPSLNNHRTVEENTTKVLEDETKMEMVGATGCSEPSFTDNIIVQHGDDVTTNNGICSDVKKTEHLDAKAEVVGGYGENHVKSATAESEANESYVESEGSDALESFKPSPNVSLEDLSSSDAAFNGGCSNSNSDQQMPSAKTVENNNVSNCDLFSASPQKKTNLLKVQEYLQSLPSPARRDKIEETPNTKMALSHISHARMTQLPSCTSTESPEKGCEDGNVSICSGSQSMASRHSELSSLTGRGAIGRGLFYGCSVAAEGSSQACPFPDEWQHQTIPECIENDDEID